MGDGTYRVTRLNPTGDPLSCLVTIFSHSLFQESNMQVLVWYWWNEHVFAPERKEEEKGKGRKGEKEKKRERDKHVHTVHHCCRVVIPWCKASVQELLSFALLASEQVQKNEVVVGTMLFK